jgi:serine phosphatase RsbU (regulator of sigma subunit)
MSIRTHLILAFLGIILLMAVGVFLIANRLSEISKRESINFAEALVKQNVDANYRLSKKVLTRYGEFMVEEKAESVAKELAPLLAGRKTYNYAKLRRDKRLRKIAIQGIYTLEGKAGFTDLYDKHGVMIFHPDKNVEGHNQAEWAQKYPELARLEHRSFRERKVYGYYYFFDEQGRLRRRFSARVQVPGTPLVVAAIVNIDEFFLPTQQKIRRAGQEILAQARATIVAQATAEKRQFAWVGLLSLLGLCLAGVLAGVLLAQRISRPLKDLGNYAKKLPQEDFSAPAKPESGVPRKYLKHKNEIGNLAESFDFMEVALRREIHELLDTTAAKEKIESELHIAREIQMSILPKIFPPFPRRRDFDIYAIIEPAKEVGGDFYDFFLLDETHFCFVIADVSDKGVPASLYMAVTKTLIKALAQQGHSPGEILTRLNRELVEGNTTSMFVTVFLGILDTVSGRVVYANGGHNPPLIIRDQGPVFLAPSGNPLVGALEDLKYETSELVLARREALFLYTDGVTEASSGEAELFSEERLQESLQGLRATSPQETIEAVKAAVNDFAAGAPQADDITMLMIRFLGPE